MEILTQQTLNQLKTLILDKSPHEAVGLLTTAGLVIELPNRSSNPQTTFEIHKSDIIASLEGVEPIENLTLWHSHPGGGIGPSRQDLQQRVEYFNHLVLAIVDGELVLTWY